MLTNIILVAAGVHLIIVLTHMFLRCSECIFFFNLIKMNVTETKKNITLKIVNWLKLRYQKMIFNVGVASLDKKILR